MCLVAESTYTYNDITRTELKTALESRRWNLLGMYYTEKNS